MDVAIGGDNQRKLQVRATRKDGWTKARRRRFLELLTVTCNVSSSAQAVGMTPHTAQRLRRRDAEFALRWEEALALGYERLEDELLAHALGQPSGDNPSAEEIEAATADTPRSAFDPALAMQVLKLRGGRATARGRRIEMAPVFDQAALDRKLLERLDALADRLAKQ